MAKIYYPEILPEVKDAFLNAIRAGNYVEQASLSSGLTQNILSDIVKLAYHEMKRAHNIQKKQGWREPHIRLRYKEYVDFYQDLQKAIGNAEVRLVTLVTKAAETNWTAAMTLLERRHPDRWGRRERVDHKVTGKVSVDLDLRRKAAEEIDVEDAEIVEEVPEKLPEGERETLETGEEQRESATIPVETKPLEPDLND